MTIHMRPTDGAMGQAIGVKYAPSRDIMYLYPNLIQACEEYLYDGPEPAVQKWLGAEKISEDDRAKTVQTFCVFLNTAHKNPDETIQDCMERSGFLEVPWQARTAFLAYVGMANAGTFFKATRDIHELGQDAIPPVERLVRSGREASKYLSKGWLGRMWSRFWSGKFPREKRYSVDR